MQELVMTRPDDWHLHLRDGVAMASVLPHTSRRFARAVVMPNLKPPVTTTAQALDYRGQILAALPKAQDFRPLMTLYLTETTTPADIEAAAASDDVVGIKYYPAGATTHSESGVRAIENVEAVLEAMQDHDLPLLIHGEDIDASTDVFDREKSFIDHTLAPLTENYPKLRVVLEHITTSDAVDFVINARDNVAATITPQHLLLNRNALFDGGLRPHHYCLPVLKREAHRKRVLEAATSGNPRFFLGTDSAPHATDDKESACGCAGIFSAHAGIELYAEAFDAVGRLDRLEGFASHHGPDFYNLARNQDSIKLVKQAWTVPARYDFADGTITPFRAGDTIAWKLDDAND